MINQIHVLTLAGQRSVPDKDFKEIMRKLERAEKTSTPLPPEKLEEWQRGVAKINNIWGEIRALHGG